MIELFLSQILFDRFYYPKLKLRVCFVFVCLIDFYLKLTEMISSFHDLILHCNLFILFVTFFLVESNPVFFWQWWCTLFFFFILALLFHFFNVEYWDQRCCIKPYSIAKNFQILWQLDIKEDGNHYISIKGRVKLPDFENR